jgi:alpha-tubulin suppressor-like RCC1 family protein
VLVKVSYQGLRAAEEDFVISHKTTSSEFEFHNLMLKLKCYKLGQTFKEILTSGQGFGTNESATNFAKAKYLQQQVPAATSAASVVHFGSENEWISVGTGERHSCAVNMKGELFSWGLGQQGQLGLTHKQTLEQE